MGWKDLLQENQERNLIAPWIGGRTLHTKNRAWKIEANLPQEHGWYHFDVRNRTASLLEKSEFPNTEILINHVTGYLVGNRLILDNIQSRPRIEDMISNFERVYLIESGLERFARIKAGRLYENGPLIFEGEEFPLGKEDDVLNAFLDQKQNIDDISGVSPALEAAFRFENHIRAEIERRHREEEEKRRQEEIRQRMRESLGDGAIRRQIALQDFGEAAKAALAVGGAVYLDHRRGTCSREMIVKYRLNNMRLECTCDARTLRVIDSGICLTAEYSDAEFDAGTKGDTWFTLESLPGVASQAEREGKLVIYRHG